MDMRIAGRIVIDPVGDHALCRNIGGHEIPHQRNVLRSCEFKRERDSHILGELGITAFLG